MTSNKKRVVILGATGMLGSMVYNVFKDKYSLILVSRSKEEITLLDQKYGGVSHHKVYDFDFNAIYQDYIKSFKGSIQGPSFKKFIKEIGQVDALINCVGLITPNSLKDTANTFFINSALPNILADYFGSKMIHPSTDCIFNGTEGFPYDEKSKASPVDLYGLSKSLGESKKCLTLRTSFIGPEIIGFLSLLEWFRRQSGQTIKGFSRHFWNGITTKEFANICSKIIDNRDKYPSVGLFNIFSNAVSKYEMLLKFKEKYKVDCQILSDESSEVNRTMASIYPLCSELKIPSFNQMIDEL